MSLDSIVRPCACTSTCLRPYNLHQWTPMQPTRLLLIPFWRISLWPFNCSGWI